MTAEKRRLGQTGVENHTHRASVSCSSRGRGLLTNNVLAQVAEGESNRIVQAALDGGINWFDTAAVYGGGRSERSLAAALSAAGVKDSDVIVGTKWFPLLKTAGNIPRTIEQRLSNLDGYSIDLFMVPRPDGSLFDRSRDECHGRPGGGGPDSLGRREQLQSQADAASPRGLEGPRASAGGPIRCSTAWPTETSKRTASSKTARELDVTIVAWGPLASGLLTGRFHDDPRALAATPVGRRWQFRRRLDRTRPLIDALREIGSRYEATPAQVALNWLIHSHGDGVVAIPGASKVRQAAESAGAMGFQLTGDELGQLDRASKGS